MTSRSQIHIFNNSSESNDIQNNERNPGKTTNHSYAYLGHAKVLKDQNRARNSIPIPVYPKTKKARKQRNSPSDRIIFTVIGNRVAKEFIYCVKMVQGMHKYRQQTFGAPIIRGVSGMEWPLIFNDLKVRHGGLAYCVPGQVAVLRNGYYVGGEKELKDFIEEAYIYHMALNYTKESIGLFRHFLKCTGRACAYMHICIDDKPIGSLLYMLYSDICPKTCENFMRLCQTTKGGYGGTPVHRIVEDGWIQCGGFGLKDTPLGCENFVVPHDRRGVLGMCNDNRDIDCSTQFYILLQPARWMNHKYVAFGQLIDGNETLKKIEEVSTFYESPFKNIIIFKAGLLNLECDDIMINRGAVAYIDAHIDDLVSISEMLSEWLWQLVETEIEAKHIRLMATVVAEVMGIDDQSRNVNDGTIDMPPSRRMNKFQSNPLSFHKTFGSEMSMEGELYGEDQFMYHQATPQSSVIKPKLPYYIPLTDVLYPGERDSNFDLKRLLQGNYCLQSDLDPQQSKKFYSSQRAKGEQLNTISGLMLTYNGAMEVVMDIDEDSSTSTFAEEDYIDDLEKKCVEEYMRDSADKVSFSGNVVKNIGKKHITKNFLENPNKKFADEEIRRMRLALQDFRSKANKKVSISVSPWEMHSQIQRRQTGIVPLSISVLVEDEEDQIDEDYESNKGRSVSIGKTFNITNSPSKIQRRQTGFHRISNIDESLTEMNEPEKQEERSNNKKEKVRIAPESLENHEFRLPSVKSRGSSQEYESPKVRPSVLVRLYDDVAIDNDDIRPTLKDYKPKELKRDLMLSSSDNFKNLLKKDTHRFSLQIMDTDVAEGKSDYGKIATSSGKRPTLTIAAYKLKNLQYAEKMKQQNNEKNTKNLTEDVIPKTKTDHETVNNTSFRRARRTLPPPWLLGRAARASGRHRGSGFADECESVPVFPPTGAWRNTESLPRVLGIHEDSPSREKKEKSRPNFNSSCVTEYGGMSCRWHCQDDVNLAAPRPYHLDCITLNAFLLI